MMVILDKLKDTALKLRRQVAVLYYAGRNPELPVLSKLLIVLTIGYALSPIDLIPDFIPLLGYLDDLIILPLLIALCLKTIPLSVMDEAVKTAEQQPLALKKNWKAGIIIILIWIAVIWRIIIEVAKFLQ